ncbi:MAG: molybdopterin-dependent oxidoreductase [Planctomycetota bacterium]
MGVLGRRFPKRDERPGGDSQRRGICDAAADAGFRAVLGDAVGFDLRGIEDADCIVLWGLDPLRTMPHLVPRVKRAMEGGAKVWVIDIQQSDTAEWVQRAGGRFLRVYPGSDAALALGLASLAFEERRADLTFLKNECVGAAEFREHLRGRYGLEAVAAMTGATAEDLRALAGDVHGAQAPVLKFGIGLARRRVGAMSLRAMASYAAVLGLEDRVHWQSGDHFDLDLSPMEGWDLRPAGAPTERMPLVRLGAELESGRFDAAFVWGHNPAITVADTERVRRGLARPDLFLVVHELVWTHTAQLADVVLPATTHLEQPDLIRSYGQRVLHSVPPLLDPRGECRGNVAAFAAIAKALDLPAEVWDCDAAGWVERLLEHNRARFSDEEFARLLAHEPVHLGPRPKTHRGTPSGKVELYSETLAAAGQPPMAEYQRDEGVGSGDFWLWPSPSKATHNSTFLYSPRHRARLGAPQVRMHPGDAERLGLADGDPVQLHNQAGSLILNVRLDGGLPTGALAVDGFVDEPQVPGGGNVNSLVPGELSLWGSGGCQYSTRVSVRAVPRP